MSVVWIALAASALCAFVLWAACRVGAMAVEDMDDWRADLEREWPQMPDLEGVDIFPHLPISGKPESE